MEAVLYFLVGTVLAVLVLVYAPYNNGFREGIAIITFLFWPMTCLIAIPLSIAYLFGWRAEW